MSDNTLEQTNRDRIEALERAVVLLQGRVALLEAGCVFPRGSSPLPVTTGVTADLNAAPQLVLHSSVPMPGVG